MENLEEIKNWDDLQNYIAEILEENKRLKETLHEYELNTLDDGR